MITIRKAENNDVSLIVQLSSETFYESYAAFNTEENMKLYVEQHFEVNHIDNELKNLNSHLLLAYNNDEISGYSKMSMHHAPAQLSNYKTIEIERFYVLRKFQRNKIGTALMNHCIQFAKSNNKEVLWLGVWEQNNKAIKFYEHYGFKKYGVQDFVFGNDVQQDYIMALML